MTKFTLLFAATAMATGAFALPSYVMFSSEGPDKYADGTTVLPGEVYALVWTKTGADFEGINADGTVVNAETSKIISAAPIATDGHCPTVMYMLTGANADLASSGKFTVYLFDTRVASASGEKVVGGVTNGKIASVNATTAVTAKVDAGAQTTAGEKVTETTKAVATAVPAEALKPENQPKITAMQVVNGQVIVTVANTFPYLQYGISAGKTPSKLDQTELVDGVNGPKSGDLTLIVDDPADNRFFKVIRK